MIPVSRMITFSMLIFASLPPLRLCVINVIRLTLGRPIRFREREREQNAKTYFQLLPDLGFNHRGLR